MAMQRDEIVVPLSDDEPLEIVDYSTVGPFEASVELVEKFLRLPPVTAALMRSDATEEGGGGGVPLVLGEEIRNAVNGESVVVELHKNDANHPVAQLLMKTATRAHQSSSSSSSRVEEQHLGGQPSLFLLCRYSSTSYFHKREDSAGMLSLMSCAVESLVNAATAVNSSSSSCSTSSSAAAVSRSPPLWLLGLPCFAPTGDASNETFTGICRGASTVTRYSIEAFASCPPALQYLTGIIDLFQLHVGLRSRIMPPGIVITCEKDYFSSFRDQPIAATSGFSAAGSAPIDDESSSWDDAVATENELLLLTCGEWTIPVGTATDPLLGVKVTASWADVNEVTIIDNSVQSTFDPFSSAGPQYHQTSGKATMSNAAASSGSTNSGSDPVSSRLQIDAVLTRRNAYELSHHAASSLGEFVPVVVADFEKLCEEEGSLHADHHNPHSIAASTDELQRCAKQVVYPDADEHGAARYAAVARRSLENVERFRLGVTSAGVVPTAVAWKDPRWTYWPSSFVARFAHIAAARLERGDDVLALWLMCIDDLNRRITHNDRTESASSNIPSSSPDERQPSMHWTQVIGFPKLTPPVLDSPLIIQKLQLVQYCGHLLLNEDSSHKNHVASSHDDVSGQQQQQSSKDGWADDDEDLFSCGDAETEEDVRQTQKQHDHHTMSHAHEVSSTEGQPAPAASPQLDSAHGDGKKQLFLLCGEICETPPASLPPIKTMDQIEQEQKSMADLGAGKAASAYRTYLQGRDSLLQDMCLFLWANRRHLPRVLFEDFVRWHSPRDFDEESFQRDLSTALEERQKCGSRAEATAHMDVGKYLSLRMSKTGPDAVWYKLWQDAATPLSPVELQLKGLDPHREILVAMQWLANNVTAQDLLVLICQSNAVAGALHRVLSQHVVIGRPRIAAHMLHFAGQVSAAAAKLSSVYASSSFSNRSDLNTLEVAISGLTHSVAEAEAELACVMSLDRVLHRQLLRGSSSSSPDTHGPCPSNDDEAIMDMLDTLIAGGDASKKKHHETSAGSSRTRGQKIRLTGQQWGLLQALFKRGGQQAVEKRYRLECLAERPLNSPATRQLLAAETGRNGSMRIGLSLTEEMM